ncbi:MAG: cyclic nucleotide-gated ion channel [Geminicoccaceae bacterium]
MTVDWNERRRQLHRLLEDDEAVKPGPDWLDLILMALIAVSVTSSILETVEPLAAAYGAWFAAIEITATLAFTLEYVARVWVAIEDRAGRYKRPFMGRLRYMVTPLAVIDLLAILPFYLGFFLDGNLTFLRVFRLLRLLKITRYSPALALFEVVLFNERRALFSALSVMVLLLILISSGVYLAEHQAQPQAFASVPHAMWWGVATLTTVGYGDVIPVTALGRLMGGLASMLGIGMFALPAAILGAAFARELSKQQFAATAAMVAKVPLFSHLPLAQLAELTSLLQPRALPPRFRVMRRGEFADGMYFVLEGQVMIRWDDETRRLGAGDFFGEVSLIAGTERTASVTTLTATRLLRLAAEDFHRLIGGDPAMRAAVFAAARARRPELFPQTPDEKKDENAS